SPTEFSPVNFKRDQMLRSDNIGKLTTATAYLSVYLADAEQEREDITLSVRVPASLVNYIEAGMLIDVKLTHLPGLEDFTTLPIIRCSKLPTPGRTDTWDVRIQLSENVKSALSLGGDPGDLPHDEDTGGHWWSGAFTITGDEYAYSGVTRDGFQPSTQYNFSITVGEDSGHPGTYATNVGPQTNLADTDLNSPDLAIDETEFSNSSGNMSLTTPGPGGDTTVWTGTITTDASVDPLDVFDMRGTTADGDHSHTHTTGVFFWFDPVDDPTFETVPPAVGTWITQDLNPPDGAQTT